jgi:transposase
MLEACLFGDLPENRRGSPEAETRGAPRLVRANRAQLEFRPLDLDSLIPEEHEARLVWEYVSSLDLAEAYGKIQAVEGHAGRPAIDPRIPMALWLYATVDGVGSARELDRLCREHAAYQWICGGVSVNYHTLSDFRTGAGQLLDRLLTENVAALMAKGVVELKRVAQDGMRVRASAGAASFRREKTLEKCLEEAEEQVRLLREEVDGDLDAGSRRLRARRERAARERKERVEAALAQLPEVKAKKAEKDREEKARVSTTEPGARVMKMGDGGFRPAHNVELCTDTASQVIVGADVTNAGSDMGQMGKMVNQLEERYGRAPEEILVDGGFAKLTDIEEVSDPEHGCTVYAPVKETKDSDRDPHRPLPGDSEAVAEWRERMGTEEAKEIYKERAATAECVNAIARNRGLHQFPVRGSAKVKAVVLWFVLAHNMMRTLALAPGAFPTPSVDSPPADFFTTTLATATL